MKKNHTNRNPAAGKPELVVPAGDIERFKTAVHYGADAVYVGGAGLNLRAYTAGFTLEELSSAAAIAHESGVKIYVAVNIFAHNRHLNDARPYMQELAKLDIHGLIISDPGILSVAREAAPNIPYHLSTQAGVTNWRSAAFWRDQGFKRIVPARELTLEEIRDIRDKADVELEVFVHGAMCLAYSGRCLLSAYYTGRSGNRGECTHPCRWGYTLWEKDRPGDPLVLSEEKGESYILSSRDLNMIRHIPHLVQAGVSAFKIEGRMKGLHYVATVTRAYRETIDAYFNAPGDYTFDPFWDDELEKISHRPYHTGFYFGKPQQVDPADKESYFARTLLAGVVLDYDHSRKTALVEQRNRFEQGEELEVFSTGGRPFSFKVGKIFNLSGEEVSAAPHPRQHLRIPVEQTLRPMDILRKKQKNA